VCLSKPDDTSLLRNLLIASFLTTFNDAILEEVDVKVMGKNVKIFHAIGFYNEADTLESSSILIYQFHRQSIYTQRYISKPY